MLSPGMHLYPCHWAVMGYNVIAHIIIGHIVIVTSFTRNMS